MEITNVLDEAEQLRNDLCSYFDTEYLNSLVLEELQDLYDQVKLEEFLPGELEFFQEASITSKDQLLASIRRCRDEYAQASVSDDPGHTPGFYKTLDRLLDEFYYKVLHTTLPEPLPDWWSYSYVITTGGIQLYLDHYDWSCGADYNCYKNEGLAFLDVPAKHLTVSKFAEIYGIEEVTVRQWIRRGKIRSAMKLGKEWRIPELAELPKHRGYVACRYYWKEELTDLPDKFSFLNEFESAKFEQAYNNADLYLITLDLRTTKSNQYISENTKKTKGRKILRQYPDLQLDKKGRIKMTREDREELELYMIANPFVYCNSGDHKHLHNETIDEYGNDYCPNYMSVIITEQS